jgi:hypothetical protein
MSDKVLTWLTWENVFLNDQHEEITKENALWLRDDDVISRSLFLKNNFLSPEFDQKAFELRNILLYIANGRNICVEKTQNNTRKSEWAFAELKK